MTTLPERLVAFLDRNVPPEVRAHRRVELAQRGRIRLSPSGAWRSFSAEQWFSSEEVAFCWHARVKMAPLVTAVVEDAFENGHGRLDVKIWGKLPVAHEEGPGIDSGEMQRYLAEIPWNPAALLRNETLRFAEVGDGLRVWVGDPDCYVDFAFDGAGDIVATHTETRAYQGGEPRPWHGRFMDYATMGGIRVPRRAEVAWELDDGPFTYWEGELTELSTRP